METCTVSEQQPSAVTVTLNLGTDPAATVAELYLAAGLLARTHRPRAADAVRSVAVSAEAALGSPAERKDGAG